MTKRHRRRVLDVGDVPEVHVVRLTPEQVARMMVGGYVEGVCPVCDECVSAELDD